SFARVGIWLENQVLLAGLKSAILNEFPNMEIIGQEDNFVAPNIVFIDDVEFMTKLQGVDQTIIFVRPTDKVAILMEKLRITASRILKS
ncbi:MAG: hypothetical protein M3Q07_10380, partial [Pseudobdellovibrionaceae bacterium]|nr:hypothetical protein [Pseudobdellovibrionaceae bacterium]